MPRTVICAQPYREVVGCRQGGNTYRLCMLIALFHNATHLDRTERRPACSHVNTTSMSSNGSPQEGCNKNNADPASLRPQSAIFILCIARGKGVCSSGRITFFHVPLFSSKEWISAKCCRWASAPPNRRSLDPTWCATAGEGAPVWHFVKN